MPNTIIDNPIDIRVQISKVSEGSWRVEPALIAFATPKKPSPKNIIFLLDNSGSMTGDGRLEKVKTAVSNLLDKLTEIDTFSIVSFNDEAHVCVQCQHASSKNIPKAKSQIKLIQAANNTNFKAAFIAIKSPEMIPPASHTTVIFLTDGQDSYGCTAQSLADVFPNKKLPRVIPIGVCLAHNNTFLDTLATFSHHEGRAIYINDDNPSTYQNAFDKAFQQATEQSHKPARLEMTIQAKDKANQTTLDTSRTLHNVHYDGSSATSTALYFDSPTPPHHLKLRFHCDNRSLQTERKLTPSECRSIQQARPLTIHMHAFKWKDNRRSSWILALLSVTIGAIVLASVALLILSAPPINLWLWPTLATCALASVVGLSLIATGVIALARKTFFLPTKTSAEAEKERTQQPSVDQQGFFSTRPRAKMLASITLAAGGAAGGYIASTTTAAANAVVATGISPVLFSLGCAAAGAIALLLLAYGCMLVYKACSRAQPSPQPQC